MVHITIGESAGGLTLDRICAQLRDINGITRTLIRTALKELEHELVIDSELLGTKASTRTYFIEGRPPKLGATWIPAHAVQPVVMERKSTWFSVLGHTA